MNARVYTFVALAYAGSYGIALAVYLSGGMRSPLAGLFLLAMLVPALAAIVTRLVHREGFRDVRWRAFSVKHLAIGLIVPAATAALTLVYVLVARGSLEPAAWLEPGADGMIAPPERAAIGTDAFPAGELGTKLFTKLVLNFPILCVFALGEEYGWRSYLQTRLTERLGTTKAIVWTAVLWAFWHTGMHLVDTEDLSGPADVVLSVFVLVPASIAGVGLLFGWLFHRSGSLWVVVLAHAAMNKYGGAAVRFFEIPSERGVIYAQLAAGIAIGAAMVVVLRRDHAREAR